jgi:hypothetical protein
MYQMASGIHEHMDIEIIIWLVYWPSQLYKHVQEFLFTLLFLAIWGLHGDMDLYCLGYVTAEIKCKS